MIKMFIQATGFALAMVVCSVAGHGAGATGCDQNLKCRPAITPSAQPARIENVNVAAGALMRQIVSDSTARGNRGKQ